MTTSEDYMKLPYHIIVWYDDDEDWWFARIQEFAGCMADGETRAAALEALDEVMRLWLDVSLERGHPIPQPLSITG
jgi:predicted RNase H-like HicB family nuclease